MKTKLFLLATFCLCSFSYSQISINEAPTKRVKNEISDSLKFLISYKNEKEKLDQNNLSRFNKIIKNLDIKTQGDTVVVNQSELHKILVEFPMMDYKTSNPESDVFYYEYYENLYQKTLDTLTQLKKSKKVLQDDLVKLATLQNNIREYESQRDKYYAILKNLDALKKNNKWFPTLTSPEERILFYEGLYSKENDRNNYLLSNFSTQIGTNTAAVKSELIASYFKYFRLSFGTLITNSNQSDPDTDTEEETVEEDETNAFQRLLSSGGGNVYLNLDFPLYYLQSKTVTLFLNSSAKAGVVLTQFSNDVDTSTGNGSVGLNLYGSISSDDQKSFLFFTNIHFGGYGGGTDYYNKLMLSKRGVFAFGHILIGLDISKSIRVSYTPLTFGSDDGLRSKRGVIGIQLLTGLFD